MGRPVVHKTVFDWEIRHLPEMDYRLVETGGEGGINGGIMKPKAGPWPGKLAFYIDVDDLDTFGNEVDIKLAYSPWKPLKFDWMYGLFHPGDILNAGLAGWKTEHFIYSTASVIF